MLFKEVFVDQAIKQKLLESAKQGRIPHAQMFVGGEGVPILSLALAYAQYLNCLNPSDNDSCGSCKACIKHSHLTHPDLHFVYPVVKTKKISKPYSTDFLNEWRQFVLENKFHSLENWLEILNASDSQATIYAHEAENIIKTLSYKPFEGKFKIMIIWLPEKMNIATANKLLKIIEEPPKQTIFILVTHNEELILPTIRSRTQILRVPPLTPDIIANALKNEYPDAPDELIEQAAKAGNGNYFNAQKFLLDSLENTASPFFELFKNFMKYSYELNVENMLSLVETLNSLGKEKQKQFLSYSIYLFRQSLMYNLGLDSIAQLTEKEKNFITKFSKLITTNNIENLNFEFSKAISDIERNAFDRLLFLDLMFKTSKLLKQA